jgi:hypothetical protein
MPLYDANWSGLIKALRAKGLGQDGIRYDPNMRGVIRLLLGLDETEHCPFDYNWAGLRDCLLSLNFGQEGVEYDASMAGIIQILERDNPASDSGERNYSWRGLVDTITSDEFVVLNDWVGQYQANVIANGGTISLDDLTALNVFTNTLISEGLLASKPEDHNATNSIILYLNPLAGNNLAAASVPLIAPSDVGNIEWFGVVEGDYSREGGVYFTSGKSASTGIIPATHYTDDLDKHHEIAYFPYWDSLTTGYGYILGNRATSGSTGLNGLIPWTTNPIQTNEYVGDFFGHVTGLRLAGPTLYPQPADGWGFCLKQLTSRDAGGATIYISSATATETSTSAVSGSDNNSNYGDPYILNGYPSEYPTIIGNALTSRFGLVSLGNQPIPVEKIATLKSAIDDLMIAFGRRLDLNDWTEQFAYNVAFAGGSVSAEDLLILDSFVETLINEELVAEDPANHDASTSTILYLHPFAGDDLTAASVPLIAPSDLSSVGWTGVVEGDYSREGGILLTGGKYGRTSLTPATYFTHDDYATFIAVYFPHIDTGEIPLAVGWAIHAMSYTMSPWVFPGGDERFFTQQLGYYHDPGTIAIHGIRFEGPAFPQPSDGWGLWMLQNDGLDVGDFQFYYDSDTPTLVNESLPVFPDNGVESFAHSSNLFGPFVLNGVYSGFDVAGNTGTFRYGLVMIGNQTVAPEKIPTLRAAVNSLMVAFERRTDYDGLPLNAWTRQYFENVILAGGGISGDDLLELNNFVDILISQGLVTADPANHNATNSIVLYFNPLAGSNLAAASVPLIAPASVGSITWTGVVEGDYSRTVGFSLVPGKHGVINLDPKNTFTHAPQDGFLGGYFPYELNIDSFTCHARRSLPNGNGSGDWSIYAIPALGSNYYLRAFNNGTEVSGTSPTQPDDGYGFVLANFSKTENTQDFYITDSETPIASGNLNALGATPNWQDVPEGYVLDFIINAFRVDGDVSKTVKIASYYAGNQKIPDDKVGVFKAAIDDLMIAFGRKSE